MNLASEQISSCRTTNNARDLFGREVWPRDRDTVAVTTIDRKPVFGINSTAPSYVIFQMAEVAVPRGLFGDILRLIAQLRAPPAPA